MLAKEYPETPEFMIKRSRLMIEIYDHLKESQFVNLYGEEGRAKTCYLNHFVNELIKRNSYDGGVKVIRLSRLEEKVYQGDKSIKRLLSEEFGQRFESNMNQFFNGTRQLIVLDDFNLIVNSPKFAYPISFLQALKTNRIHAIFVSRERLTRIEEIDRFVPVEMPCLEPEESLALALVSDPKRLYHAEVDISPLVKHNLLNQCQGYPEKITKVAADLFDSLLAPPELHQLDSRVDMIRNYGEDYSQSDSDSEKDEKVLEMNQKSGILRMHSQYDEVPGFVNRDRTMSSFNQGILEKNEK